MPAGQAVQSQQRAFSNRTQASFPQRAQNGRHIDFNGGSPHLRKRAYPLCGGAARALAVQFGALSKSHQQNRGSAVKGNPFGEEFARKGSAFLYLLPHKAKLELSGFPI